MSLSRRDFVRTVRSRRSAWGCVRELHGAGDGMIVRMQEPRNLETPLRTSRQ